MGTIDWGMPPQDTPPADPPTPSQVGDETVQLPAIRRRKRTDLVLDPGDDARALARLLGQDLTDFVHLAIADRITALRSKLHA